MDIAHARVAASALGVDIYEYLNKLPLERIREIHVSGVKEANIHQLSDFHNEMDDKDIELLEYVMKRTNKLEMITHEFTPLEKDYYLLRDENGNINTYPTVSLNGVNPEAKQALEKDLKRLREIVFEYNSNTKKKIEER